MMFQLFLVLVAWLALLITGALIDACARRWLL